MNKKWTFRFRGEAVPALLRFLVVTLIAYLANLGTLLLLVQTGVNSYLAQSLAVVPYTIVGYLGSRFFAFGSTPGTPPRKV